MVRLVPMRQEEFASFVEHDIQEYAKEQVQAGYLLEAEAIEKSRKDHEALLPDGLATKDHHLYDIQDAETGQTVGFIWLRSTLDSPRPTGFIFDIEIHEAFRRKGYARQAMLALEDIARGMGIRRLGLHVFAYNDGARKLYESLGYRVSSLNMLKDL